MKHDILLNDPWIAKRKMTPCMAKTVKVLEIINQAEANEFCEVIKTDTTIIIKLDGETIYQGIKKGSGSDAWIIRYMKKAHAFNILSSKVCIYKGCDKKLKLRIAELKPTATMCYRHWKAVQFAKGHIIK